MYRQLIQPVLLLFGLTLLLSGCTPEPDFSNTPQIEYLGIDKSERLPSRGGVGGAERDSIVITLNYRDGDGDLGLFDQKTKPTKADSILINSPAYREWGNYQIKTLRLVNNKFEELKLSENAVLFFPQLKEGSRGAIEGILDFRQSFLYSRSARIVPVKFQIKIRDRALNESNVVETDTVWVPILVQ
ncbi:MAG: hypothetical protein EAZ91_24030 [Cytophagales bacterium]|nr:MAG: hypothetical protein EAZ91_24030 [Cytophagales bacterium]